MVCLTIKFNALSLFEEINQRNPTTDQAAETTAEEVAVPRRRSRSLSLPSRVTNRRSLTPHPRVKNGNVAKNNIKADACEKMEIEAPPTSPALQIGALPIGQLGRKRKFSAATVSTFKRRRLFIDSQGNNGYEQEMNDDSDADDEDEDDDMAKNAKEMRVRKYTQQRGKMQRDMDKPTDSESD